MLELSQKKKGLILESRLLPSVRLTSKRNQIRESHRTHRRNDSETNITEMAVNLFGFICCHLGMYRDIFQYWLKRGKKEGVRVAYDYLIGGIFSNGEDETKRGKRKLRNLQD